MAYTINISFLDIIFYFTNCTTPHFSGTCMFTTPCGDHTQLSSAWPFTFSYFPPTTRTRHSTREKLIRHSSPAVGRPLPLRSTNADHGKASSTDHPLSRSRASFNVP